MNDIKDKYWKDFSFDEFPVHVNIVPCSNDNLLFDDYDKVKTCLKSQLRDLHHRASIIKELQECNNHTDHHLNEIVFSSVRIVLVALVFRLRK